MSTNLPPLTSSALAALLAATNAFSGATINGLGDSIIGGQSFYSQYNDPAYQAQYAVTPAWATGVAYPINSLCKSGGLVYRCSIAGTAGATAPSGTSKNAVSDGGASWIYSPAFYIFKHGSSMLTWAEIFSNNRLNFDMTLGYGGIANSLLKMIVVNGGSGYASGDTFTCSNTGATGTLQVVNGAVVSATVTNPGYSPSAFLPTINTTAGTGCVLSYVTGGSGTFGCPGCLTSDMVARMSDVLANPPSILVIHGGTNDGVAAPAVSATTTMANLRTCYEQAMRAGIKVIAVPLLPSATAAHQTAAARGHAQRVNRFIRAYVKGAKWANPLGFKAIAIADATQLFVDPTNAAFSPIGGLGGVANAVTQDGVHPSNRGGQYLGYVISKAAEQLIGAAPVYVARAVSADDGYDPVLNPGGNIMEGLPWQASTAYALQQQVSNGGILYRCTVAGTSAASGGPTGTGTPTDGTVTWAYMTTTKASTMTGGSAGTLVAVAGVTSGAVATGWQFQRDGGSATGSVVCAVESPLANGLAGARQSIVFSLGGGTVNELWGLYLAPQYASLTNRNILAGDINATLFEAAVELELSGVANMTGVNLRAFADGSAGGVIVGPSFNGAGFEMMASATDPLVLALGGAWPNGGKLLLKTPPFYLPPTATASSAWAFEIGFGFNASGAGGSATATVKVNYAVLQHAGVA